jgi:hypothetical protein
MGTRSALRDLLNAEQGKASLGTELGQRTSS